MSNRQPLRLLPIMLRVLLLLSFVIIALPAASAQNSSSSDWQPTLQTETKVFVDENGTQTLSRTLETEHKKTNDGEVEIQRYREPVYGGDNRVSWEREVRSRKLPDGTVDKETTFRNPDGANRMQPTQVVREKITRAGDATTSQREVLRFDLDGQPQPTQRETVIENGTDMSKQSVRVVERPNASHEWETVERQNTSSRSSAEGSVTDSVRQLPDATGRLADYERSEERSSGRSGNETREITIKRRDLSNTDSRQFLLVEHTKETSSTAPGTTVRHIVTESDFLYGVAARTEGPQVVEDRTERETIVPDGSKNVVITIRAREQAEPTTLRPAGTLLEQTDSKGYIRQIFIPAQ